MNGFVVCSTTTQGCVHIQTPMLLHSLCETTTSKPKRRRMEDHSGEYYMSPTAGLLSIRDFAKCTKAIIGEIMLV